MKSPSLIPDSTDPFIFFMISGLFLSAKRIPAIKLALLAPSKYP